MADQYSETTSTGWLSRIGGAIKGIFVGLLLVLISFVLLFWNEGRAVSRAKALDEGAAAVVSVDAASIDPQNTGRLVHITGDAVTNDVLEDDEFEVSINGLRLIREVSMYQWVEKEESETKKKLGGGEETVTTYNYTKEWSDKTIDSGEFRYPDDHTNPGEMPYESNTVQAETVTVGAFQLNPSQISRIGEPRDLPDDTEITPPSDLEYASRKGSTVYIGADPAKPEIGDAKVKFSIVPPSKVSLVAAQNGETLTPFTTPSGGEIELLQDGIVPADAMFKAAHDENSMLTWILRAVGFFMMFMGLGMIFKPLSVIADVVPLFGSIVGAGTGLVAFLLAIVGSLVTIAIGWVFYRPLIGIPLLVIAVGALVFTFRKVKAATPVVPDKPAAAA